MHDVTLHYKTAYIIAKVSVILSVILYYYNHDR
jgi:hypothetical protein